MTAFAFRTTVNTVVWLESDRSIVEKDKQGSCLQNLVSLPKKALNFILRGHWKKARLCSKSIALGTLWTGKGQDSGTNQEAVRLSKEKDDNGPDQICSKGNGEKQMHLRL